MKPNIFRILAITLLVSTPAVIWAGGSIALGKTRLENPLTHLDKGEIGVVSFVSSGDGFVLDGELKVRLAGIESPQRAWPEKKREGFPLAEEATDYLDNLIMGRSVGLYYGGKSRDRYGRALAQVWLLDQSGEKQTWLQEAMVDAGYARVYTWPSQVIESESLYSAERAARKARKGIWNNRRTKSFYKIRKPDPNPLSQYVDSLQLVEGIVVSTADVRGTVYLNFGSDYKTDFTVGIGKKQRKAFEAMGQDPLGLEGARLRVRGWLELQNGPIIWINDPRRLEILQ